MSVSINSTSEEVQSNATGLLLLHRKGKVSINSTSEEVQRVVAESLTQQ